jgi:predicted secreted protein
MSLTKKKWLYIITISSLACLSGCLVKQSSPKHIELITQDLKNSYSACAKQIESVPEQAIKTSVGLDFCIAIPSNSSTGYAWEYIPRLLDSDKIKLTEKYYYATESNRIGAAGMELFIFSAQASGKLEILLAYRRHWEKDISPAITRKFEVIIQPK